MTRRTERTLTISLLILILAIGIILVVQSSGHREAFAKQEDDLEGVLMEKIDTSCTTPERQQLKKLQLCETVVDQVMKNNEDLTEWIGDLWSREEELRERVEAQMGNVAAHQMATTVSLGKLADSTQSASDRLNLLSEQSERHRGLLDSLGSSVLIPPCIEIDGESCPPETLGSLTASLRAEILRIQSDLAEHQDGMVQELSRDSAQRKEQSETAEERWRQTTEGLESRLQRLEVALEERQRLRDAIRGGLTLQPYVASADGESLTIEAAPPMEGYGCDKLQLVAQLYVVKDPERDPKGAPMAVDVEKCQDLEGLEYQCGRLGGDKNSLTLWARYRDVVDRRGQHRCQAVLNLPRSVIGGVGGREQSLRLKVGAYAEVESELLRIN